MFWPLIPLRAGIVAVAIVAAVPVAKAHHPGDAFPVTLTSLGGVSSQPVLVRTGGENSIALGVSSAYLRVSDHPQFGPVVGGNGSLLVSGLQARVRVGGPVQAAALLPWISDFPDDRGAQGGIGDPLFSAQIDRPFGDLRLGASLMSSLPAGDARRGHGAGMLQSRVGGLLGGTVLAPSGGALAGIRGVGVFVDAGLSWGWRSNGAAAVDYALTLQIPAFEFASWFGVSVEARAQTALRDSPQNPLAFAVEPRRAGDTVLVLGPMITAVVANRWEFVFGPRIPVGTRHFDWGLVMAGGVRFGS